MMSRLVWSVAAAAGLCSYAFVVSCGGDDESGTNSAGSCAAGICGTGEGGSTGPGPNAGGGGNTGCVWQCTPWDTGGTGDAATRVCIETNNCGTDEGKPVEAATLPALDENYYRCQVEPIFDHYCAQLACHGVEPDLAQNSAGRALRTYHRGRLRVSDTNETVTSCPPNVMQVPVGGCIGVIDGCGCWTEPHTPTEWQRNYDAARGFALDFLSAQPLASADDSEVLTQPLKNGGPPHENIKVWTPSDTAYTTVRAWLDGSGTMATCNTTN